MSSTTRFLLLLSFLFITKNSFAQTRSFELGLEYFSQDQYGPAQDIFDEIYYSNQDDEALYYSAICSKVLSEDNAKHKLQLLINDHPYSFLLDKAYLSLAQIYYLEQNYLKTIENYLNIEKLEHIPEDIFKLG